MQQYAGNTAMHVLTCSVVQSYVFVHVASQYTVRAAVANQPLISYEPHTLDGAASPLIRALPEYERQFRDHLTRAQAVWEASQVRIGLACSCMC